MLTDYGYSDLFMRSLSYHPRDHRKLVKLELHIRNSLSRLSALIVTMDDELSLMPVRFLPPDANTQLLTLLYTRNQ